MDLFSQEIRQTIRDVVAPLAELHGLELVDIEFIGRHRGATVRITIDSEHGVSLDDCSRLSREVSDQLDQSDALDQAYKLEVSSPGIDRPFRNAANYRRNVGKKVDVVLLAPVGKESFLRGTLEEVSEQGIVLRTEKGEALALAFDQIKRACRTLEI